MDKHEKSLLISTIGVVVVSAITFFLHKFHIAFPVISIVSGLLAYVFKLEEEKMGHGNIFVRIISIIGIMFAVLSFFMIFLTRT